MRCRMAFALCSFLLFVSLPSAVASKERDRTLSLSFVPQESTGASSPALSGAQTARPVAVTFEDGRVLDDKTVVGDGTGDDDDERFAWRTTDDVPAFAEKILRESLASWGIEIRDDADLVLHVRLAKFMVSERDQAVGSMYAASVNVAVELRSSSGAGIGRGMGSGDARRYGRKRSPENCMEVLSDAMQEAYAAFLSQPELQKAWSGEAAGAAPGAAPDTLSPPELLREILRLKALGFGPEVLAAYVRQKSLTRSFTPEDLLEWKAAGIGEDLIGAALERSRQRTEP